MKNYILCYENCLNHSCEINPGGRIFNTETTLPPPKLTSKLN